MAYRLPLVWLQPVKMTRIIAHWSAGAYRASELDKEHYHLIVEGSGNVVRGDHTISDNVSTADDDYAAHTRGCNTWSIGGSLACMAGAIESPFLEKQHRRRPRQFSVPGYTFSESAVPAVAAQVATSPHPVRCGSRA